MDRGIQNADASEIEIKYEYQETCSLKDHADIKMVIWSSLSALFIFV
jgi:hypothetical protein